MTDTPKGNLALQIVAMPKDANPSGDIFGGWLVSKMDMAGGIEARRRAKGRVVTIAIDKMIFMRKVSIGDTVCCYVDLVKVGRTSMCLNISVWTQTHQDDSLTQVAEGMFTFVALDENGKSRPVDG